MSVTSGNALNARVKMGAGFVGGGPSPQLNPSPVVYHNYAGRPRRSADSQWSMSSNTPWYPGPVGELENEEEYEDEMDVDTKTLLKIQSLVESYKKRSYKLEDYDLMPEEKEEGLEEFSGAGAAGGYTVPLGGTPKDVKERGKYSISKPYGPK